MNTTSKIEYTKDQIDEALKKARECIDDDEHRRAILTNIRTQIVREDKNAPFMYKYRLTYEKCFEIIKQIQVDDALPGEYSKEPDYPDNTPMYEFVTKRRVLKDGTFSSNLNDSGKNIDIYVKFIFYPDINGDVLRVISFHEAEKRPNYLFH